jgi:hypothetical protein
LGGGCANEIAVAAFGYQAHGGITGSGERVHDPALDLGLSSSEKLAIRSIKISLGIQVNAILAPFTTSQAQ